MNATTTPSVIPAIAGTVTLLSGALRHAVLRANGTVAYTTTGGRWVDVTGTWVASGFEVDPESVDAEHAAALAEDADRDLDAHTPRLIDAAADLSPAHAELAQLLHDTAPDAQRAALRELEARHADVDEAHAYALRHRCPGCGGELYRPTHLGLVHRATGAGACPPAGDCGDDCTAARVGLTHRHEPDGSITAGGTGGSSDAARRDAERRKLWDGAARIADQQRAGGAR